METFIYNDNFKQRPRESPHPFGEVSFLDSIAEPGMTATGRSEGTMAGSLIAPFDAGGT